MMAKLFFFLHFVCQRHIFSHYSTYLMHVIRRVINNDQRFLKFRENCRVSIFYQGSEPVLYLRDLGLVRRVMVQDFEHFSEFGFLDPRVAALGDLGLVNMRGEEWRDLKATLSPAFSSKGVKALAGHLDQVRNSSRKT